MLFQNQPHRNISGWVKWKITASAAEEFIDELPDSGDSNTSASPSETKFEDVGDDLATFAVFDRLKNWQQISARRTDGCIDLAGGVIAPGLTFAVTISL